MEPNKKIRIKKLTKNDISSLKYGVIHSQLGYSDGVSIVIKQMIGVMLKDMNIPEKNLYYLVGRAKTKNSQITENEVLWDGYGINVQMINRYKQGYGGEKSEKIEKAISKAKEIIEKFIQQKKIDVIIAHNTSHPVNFILSVALSRYYRDALLKGERTPKYLLWWHDSHLERAHLRKPASDVEQYLLEGVPGRFVEYILFINSTQFSDAEKYLLQLNKRKPGFYESMSLNHDIIYNTTDTFIDSYEDLESDAQSVRVELFLNDFKVREDLGSHDLTLSDVLFVLQHTRVIPRKRIDFALKYCFELLTCLKKKKISKAIYFFVSGHTGLKSKQTQNSLIRLHKKLCKKYNTEDVILKFVDKFNNNTDIKFEEFPRIFAKLGGITTYFSEIEGFGNNLLEVLASGLIPVVYTYPVFIKDIAKFKFKAICLDKFEIEKKDLELTCDIIKNKRKRKIWVNRNLHILRRRFKHTIIARKLTRAIIRKRTHR